MKKKIAALRAPGLPWPEARLTSSSGLSPCGISSTQVGYPPRAAFFPRSVGCLKYTDRLIYGDVRYFFSYYYSLLEH